MGRYAVILYKLSLDLGIKIPLSRLVSPKIGKYKLCAALLIILVIVFGYHLGAVRGLVVRVIGV